jgi:hypothetical protein
VVTASGMAAVAGCRLIAAPAAAPAAAPPAPSGSRRGRSGSRS